MTFRVSVYGVAIRGNSVLLVPQWDGYDIPGGKIELGESIEDALKREFREETGFDVRPHMGGALYITQDYFVHPTSHRVFHNILLYYACSIIGGSKKKMCLSESEKSYAGPAKWILIEDIKGLKFYNPIDNLKVIRFAQTTRRR